MAKQKKKRLNQNIVLVALSIAIIGLVFFVVSLVRLFQKPASTVMIKNGELINYEEFVGYIIRDEDVVDTSSYDGIVKTAVSDAERVSKGAPIMNYVSKAEEQLMKKISDLDTKIEQAIESQQTIFTNDVKTLDSEIETYIYSNLRNSNLLDSTKEYKKVINEKVEKKAKIVGELSPAGSELKSLIEERTKYETELNDAEKAVYATKAGLVSYRVDGYENILTPASFSELTIDYLKSLKTTKDQVVSANSNKVKLVNNFCCYIAIPLGEDGLEKITLNETTYLRFESTGERLIPATVEYMSTEEDGILCIFKINSNVEELTKYRKVSVDVVWWRTKGLKVNEDVIHYTELQVPSGEEEVIQSGDETIIVETSGDANVTKTIKIPTVTVKKAYYDTEVFVKILKSAKGFVILDNYTVEELEKMGVSQEIIDNRGTIKLYDELLVAD
ncbi:MAG: hypothetical protein IKJ32_02115 [Clostridia bacterium]|nr:hypothetical protein [Clostridia bacterium]